MRTLLLLLCALPALAVNPNRVLILVNDSMPAETGTGGVGASVYVGTHYATARGIPAGNILHLTTDTTQLTTIGNYQSQIQTPLLAALNASSGLLKHQILYIVPCYGIPYNVSSNGGSGRIAMDSIIAAMYNPTAFIYNTPIYGTTDAPYNQGIPTGAVTPFTTLWTPPTNRAEPFETFSDKRDVAGSWKMFVVSRLDGLSAVISAALVDNAMAVEVTRLLPVGTAYWGWGGTRNSTEYQLYIDTRVRDGAVLTYNRGITTYLHRATTDNSFVDDPKPTAPPVTNSGGAFTGTSAIFAFDTISSYPLQGQFTWATGGMGSGYISCSGNNLRSPNAENPGTSDRWGCSWVGRFIEDGATAAWGTVDEPAYGPYNFIPHGIDLAYYFYRGYSLGDAFYLSTAALRWTLFMVGDPLYQLRLPRVRSSGPLMVKGGVISQ